MKRILGIVMIAVAMLAAPMAQAELRLGVKAGANISNFTTPDQTKLDFSNASLANFTGGLTVEWLFLGGLGVDASVMYTAKGTEYKVGDDFFSEAYETLAGTSTMMKATVHYIEVPINLKYKLKIKGIEDVVAPFIYAGPSFAFKVGQDIKFGNDLFNDTKIEFNNVDVALNVGLGVEVFKHLNVAAQYGWGLGKVVDMPDMEVLGQKIEGIDMQTGVWTITLAWMF